MNLLHRAVPLVFLALGLANFSSTFGQNLPAVIPDPRTLTIDDLGWKRGADESANDGPFRLGTTRDPVLQDYEVLAYVARAVRTRFSAKFVLSEFDRENVLADYPSTNEHGTDWDNAALTGPDDFVYMNYVKDNSAWIELGIHGVRHEYWDWVIRRGKMWRWEFFDRQNKMPWDYDDLVGHLECFQKILAQYGIFSFPKSYTPPGNGYYYSASGGPDSGTLFSSFGVKYAMCNMEATRAFGTPDEVIQAGGVIHHGLLWINEAATGTDPGWPLYNAIGTVPQSHPTDGIPLTHWPNWWAENPDSNFVTGDKYIEWFNVIKQQPDAYVPKNTAQYFSQWLYRKYSTISVAGDSLVIDNTLMPQDAYTYDLLGNLLIKFPLDDGQHLSQASIDGGAEIVGYYEEFGYGYLLLSPLQPSIYHLQYAMGSSPLATCVINDGTYNVLSFTTTTETATAVLEMYGTQDVKMRLDFEPISVVSLDTGLVVNSQVYDPVARELTFGITGKDIMGQRGAVFIQGAPLQKLSIMSPNGGELWEAASSRTITWATQGLISAVSLKCSFDFGVNWITITDSTANDGDYEWLVPSIVSTGCLMRIADAMDGEPADSSDAVFSIAPVQALMLTSPNGGEVWQAGTTASITWTSQGLISAVSLALSLDGGASWMTISDSTANDGAHEWLVPALASSNCLVRIADASDDQPSDFSNAAFSILPAQSLTLTSPNGGEQWQAGTIHAITWASQGLISAVLLEATFNGGASWTTITESTANDGAFEWLVPAYDSNNCYVRVADASDGQPSDLSNARFVIVPATPILILTSPNGGERFVAGVDVTITWSTSGVLDFVKLEFSADAGNTWMVITAATENDGSYVWTIPKLASDHGLVRISDGSDGNPSDVSDTIFAIIDDTTEVTPPVAPLHFALHPAYPNPFKPWTRIQFDLPSYEQVRLVVYDIRGREVRELIFTALSAGRHTAIWDGTDATGRRVSSGVYFYHLRAGRFEAIRKITVLQ